MNEELNPQQEKVFEWIAKQASEGRDVIGFLQVMETLDIADAATLNDILQELKQRWPSSIKKITYYGPIPRALGEERNFSVSPYAYDCWNEYKEAKEKPMCPDCGLPLEEKTIVYCPSPDCEYQRDKKSKT